MGVRAAASLEEILSASRDEPTRLHVLNFGTSWAESCAYMGKVCEALADANPDAVFWNVDAEAVADAAVHFGVEAVPTSILMRNGKKMRQMDGAHAEALADAIAGQEPGDLNKRLSSLINRHKLMLFIKGTPQSPRCGFTRQLLELLAQQGIQDFDYFDILQDEEVRQGLKVYSDWPTYPQIYVGGDLLGGLDILKELVQNGQLTGLLD